MRLIGMLDSPYVRRVAISLQLLDIEFEHQSLSVFRNYDEFSAINPVVKAPTLVCDDGQVLMDSTLIIQYAEALSFARSLLPTKRPELERDLRMTGLALAATDKSVQLVYEHEQRPADKRHPPWLARVARQMIAAYAELEDEIARRVPPLTRSTITQGGLSAAVAWHFTQQMMPNLLPAGDYPALNAFSARAETLGEFKAAPHGDGTYKAA